MITAISVFLALVLAFVSSASAECAWVVWGHSVIDVRGHPTKVDDWILMDSSDTRAQCMVQLDERVNRANLRISESGESFRVLVLVQKDEGVITFNRLECLPDTVDPRGSKGSGL